MKRLLIKQNLWFYAFSTIVFLLTSLVGNAQDNTNFDKQQIMLWFENNWMWVVGGIVLLFIIALSGRRSRRITGGKRKTTTVVRDADGKTKSVTTTEEPI